MSGKKDAGKEKSTPKNAALADTISKLSAAMSHLQEPLGEKKFEKRIRKAARLLTEGMKEKSDKPANAKAAPKKTAVKKTAVKKSAKKNTTLKSV